MGQPVEKKNIVTTSPEPPPRRGAEGSFHLARAQKLAEISLNRLARAELDAIKAEEDDLHLKLVLVQEYARNGAYDRSVILANQIPGFNKDLTHHRFPLAYWDSIQKKSQEHGLDPYLILALIRQESLFNPAALSSASAFGLMQLLPSTANRTATRIGLQRPEPRDLFDPELNLSLGIPYLKELLERYSHSLPKAIAAYNAGENAVDRWEKHLKAEDEDEFIERIPYGETRLYVKLVLRNHQSYRRIYDSGR
jgi:soluble lytic murein transglycosylase-like protein